MYKNAGIKSIKEAYLRVLDGEVFYFNGEKIFFDPEFEGSPLRIGRCYASFEFKRFDEFMIEVDWRDTLEEKPRLCWVWDVNEDKKVVANVIGFDGEWEVPYRTPRFSYKNAIPLTKEEIQVFMDNAE